MDEESEENKNENDKDKDASDEEKVKIAKSMPQYTKNKNQIQCGTCGEKGHTTKDCPQLQRGDRRQEKMKINREEEDSGSETELYESPEEDSDEEQSKKVQEDKETEFVKTV